MYVLSGECTYDIDGKEVSLQKGGVIFLSKNSVYRRTSASEDFLTIFVYFHFEHDEDEPAFYQRFPAVDALEGMFLKLYRKWSARGIAYQSECTGLLYQLYAQLVQSTVSGYLPQKRRQIFEELVHSIAEDLSNAEGVYRSKADHLSRGIAALRTGVGRRDRRACRICGSRLF